MKAQGNHSPEICNDGAERQYNLDLLKAVAIIAMVLCHPILRLGTHIEGYETDFIYFFGAVIVGYYAVAAHGFMFAMGFPKIRMMYSAQAALPDTAA